MKFFDMFAGIGGFRAGLSQIDSVKCVGHCEIDTYADTSYRAIFNTEGEYFCNDARTIVPGEIPGFDLLCAGFPCQPFSQAGRRKGFDDTRGTLFFEIARLVNEKRPKYLLLENVPGIFTHDKGRTFNTILSTLFELGYHVEWQVFDSKDFHVPQSRKRVYAFCYLDKRCAGKIFPLRQANSQTLKQLVEGSQGGRIYAPGGLNCAFTPGGSGFSCKCGMHFIDLNSESKITGKARCIKSRYKSGISNRIAENSGVLVCDEPIPLITPGRENKRQNGKLYREPNAPMYTLTTQDRHGILLNGRIRILLPAECLRLQGYNDEQIAKIIAVNSDNQVYKQAGNSVTVSVVYAIGLKIKAVHDELYS